MIFSIKIFPKQKTRNFNFLFHPFLPCLSLRMRINIVQVPTPIPSNFCDNFHLKTRSFTSLFSFNAPIKTTPALFKDVRVSPSYILITNDKRLSFILQKTVRDKQTHKNQISKQKVKFKESLTKNHHFNALKNQINHLICF